MRERMPESSERKAGVVTYRATIDPKTGLPEPVKRTRRALTPEGVAKMMREEIQGRHLVARLDDAIEMAQERIRMSRTPSRRMREEEIENERREMLRLRRMRAYVKSLEHGELPARQTGEGMELLPVTDYMKLVNLIESSVLSKEGKKKDIERFDEMLAGSGMQEPVPDDELFDGSLFGVRPSGAEPFINSSGQSLDEGFAGLENGVPSRPEIHISDAPHVAPDEPFIDPDGTSLSTAFDALGRGVPPRREVSIREHEDQLPLPPEEHPEDTAVVDMSGARLPQTRSDEEVARALGHRGTAPKPKTGMVRAALAALGFTALAGGAATFPNGQERAAQARDVERSKGDDGIVRGAPPVPGSTVPHVPFSEAAAAAQQPVETPEP